MVQRANTFLKAITAKIIKAPMTQVLAELIARTINRADTGMSVPQTAAATLTSSFIARAPGKIVAARAMRGGAAAAAGESMTFDAKIAGTSALTAVITHDSTAGATSAADVFQEGAVDAAHCTFAAGDLVTLVRTYTAGGGPTPMTNTLFEVDVEYTPQS